MAQEEQTPERRDRIKDLLIEEEMKDSYLTYAMSVIVSRALPDVRDGLKPSQRRILIAMNDLNLGPRAKTRKCAKIVGDTHGNYHPHGDAAIYQTLARMAQDFVMRYPLVEGQGNFGSMDGDPPAAPRYTEARMTEVTAELLADIEHETVDFVPNYDGTRQEPTVLPARFPNLLCNGSTGIAVGMATNIPPQNVTEVCTAIVELIDRPDITPVELLKIVKGPDFPTGGLICGRAGNPQRLPHRPRQHRHPRALAHRDEQDRPQEHRLQRDGLRHQPRQHPAPRRGTGQGRRRSRASPTCATRATAPARAWSWTCAKAKTSAWC